MHWCLLVFKVAKGTLWYLNVPLNEITRQAWLKLVQRTFENDVVLALFKKIIRCDRNTVTERVFSSSLTFSIFVMWELVDRLNLETFNWVHYVWNPTKNRARGQTVRCNLSSEQHLSETLLMRCFISFANVTCAWLYVPENSITWIYDTLIIFRSH